MYCVQGSGWGLWGRTEGGKVRSRVHFSGRGMWKDDIGEPEWLAEELESPLPHCWRHKRKEETKPR